MKKLIWVVVALAAGGLFFVQQRKISRLREESAILVLAAAEAKNDAQRAAQVPQADPKEAERLNKEREELARLRAEVSALRKEKAEWQKSRGAAESAALDSAQNTVAATTPAAQAMQWVETILNAPAPTKGTETGNVRRKLLTGEALTDAEQALLVNMNSKAADLEKSPQEFADFQTAFIGSLLGWTNDARAEQIKGVLNSAMNAANQRGLDYHSPSQNADKWDEAQKALNTRATSAVQNLLKPDERALFDKAFIGVLGVDTGAK
jgi:hypothetical protein